MAAAARRAQKQRAKAAAGEKEAASAGGGGGGGDKGGSKDTPKSKRAEEPSKVRSTPPLCVCLAVSLRACHGVAPASSPLHSCGVVGQPVDPSVSRRSSASPLNFRRLLLFGYSFCVHAQVVYMELHVEDMWPPRRRKLSQKLLAAQAYKKKLECVFISSPCVCGVVVPFVLCRVSSSHPVRVAVRFVR